MASLLWRNRGDVLICLVIQSTLILTGVSFQYLGDSVITGFRWDHQQSNAPIRKTGITVE